LAEQTPLIDAARECHTSVAVLHLFNGVACSDLVRTGRAA
jgi:hypothetical protein